MKKLLTLIMAALILLSSCGGSTDSTKNVDDGAKETVQSEEPDEEIEEPDTDEEVEELEEVEEIEEPEDEKKEPTFKEEAEENTKKYPATAGKSLVTKGDNNFTGMPYYFKGILLEAGTSEAFNFKNIWLIKNEDGYVIPVEMAEGESANEGDEVEIWGTLSGDGYKIPNVDNIVGETGYLIMMQYSVNGENKI